MSFTRFRKFSAIISSNTFSALHFLLFFCKTDDMNIGSFVIFSRVPQVLFSFQFFFLSCSNWIISLDLSLRSLTFSSVISILLLSPFSGFLKINFLYRMVLDLQKNCEE